MIRTVPFRAAFDPQRVRVIRERVAAYPWDEIPPLMEDGDPWAAGVDLASLRTLCAHWLDGYDPAATTALLNRFEQVIATVDGIDIHVLHERGSGEDHETALVLTHGWPGSVLEYVDLVERLAHPERFGGEASDGIDVVVPALPGFGFSGAPPAPLGPRRIAGLWDRLLREGLGYRRYVAHGGDWGSMISAMLGLDHAAPGGGCVGIHLNYLGSRAVSVEVDAEERAFLDRCAPFVADGRAYAETHRTTPQTLAVAMVDPVAQAAWIIDKFHAWSDRRDGRSVLDVFGADRLLGNVMLYAATGRFATATWIYRAAAREVMRVLPVGTRIEVPTAFASFPCELRPRPPESLVGRTYRLVQFGEYRLGGHFAALERPEDLVEDLATFLARLRFDEVL